MLKRYATKLVVTLLLTVAVGLCVKGIRSHRPGCPSEHNYHLVEVGMDHAQVTALLGPAEEVRRDRDPRRATVRQDSRLPGGIAGGRLGRPILPLAGWGGQDSRRILERPGREQASLLGARVVKAAGTEPAATADPVQ